MSKKNITQVQKDVLVEFMVENHTQLFGKFSNLHGKQFKDAKWEEIVESLNSLGPPTKSVDQWKRVCG